VCNNNQCAQLYNNYGAQKEIKLETYIYKAIIVEAAKEADEYFWNEWLKNNPYESKIEGELANGNSRYNAL